MLDHLRKFLGVHSVFIEFLLPVGLCTCWMVHEYNYRVIPDQNTWYKENIGNCLKKLSMPRPKRKVMVRVPYYVENGYRSYTDYRYEWQDDWRDIDG